MFEEAGYKRWFYKEKTSYSSYCVLAGAEEKKFDGASNSSDVAGHTRFHLELVEVNKMLYVEVEVVSDDDAAESGGQKKLPESNLKAELEKFVVALGLNPADKDGRSWYQIISENFC